MNKYNLYRQKSKCLLSWFKVRNFLLQARHLNDFRLKWFFKWRRIKKSCSKALAHTMHACGFSTLFRMWSFNSFKVAYFSGHKIHTNALGDFFDGSFVVVFVALSLAEVTSTRDKSDVPDVRVAGEPVFI